MELSSTKRSQTLTMRACVSTYFAVAGIFAVLFVACLILAILKPGSGSWKIAIVLFLILASLVCWIAAFRLELANDTLCYRTLFRTRSVRLREIEKAEIKIDFRRFIGPPLGLLITPRQGSKEAQIIVNMKVFAKEDLNQLLDLLEPVFRGKRRFNVIKTN